MPGDLALTSLVDLCLQLAGQGATGTLAMAGPRGDAVLVLVDGRLAGARPPADGRQARLGERLVSAGRLDRPDLDTVLAEQAADPSGPALGQLLVERDLVTADTVRLFVQEQVLETLLDALSWFEGQWDFQPGTRAEVEAAEVSLPVDRALMEVRRRAAEREQVAAVVGSTVAVPSVVEGATRPASLPTDTFTVLAAIDGTRSVGAIAQALGYSHDETSRLLFRLVLQGLVQFADSDTMTPSMAAPTEEAALPASSVTGTPAPVHLADDGWATRRQEATTTADEPEPWVGWAHGAPQEPAPASPARADTATWDRSAAATEPTAPAERRDMDADTRRALFSELHEVGRANPRVEQAGPETPAPTEDATRTAAEQPSAPTPPPEPAAPSLSRSDVSDLLRELHALNLDEDR